MSRHDEQPLTVRIGTIRHELDARSDGTPSGYRTVIGRDIRRYWEIVEQFVPRVPASDARRLLDDLIESPKDALPIASLYLNEQVHGRMIQSWALADALERALILTTHYAVSPLDALKTVGIVKE